MVNRNVWLWGIQVSVAIISLAETLLLTYLGYKVRLHSSLCIGLGHVTSWFFAVSLMSLLHYVSREVRRTRGEMYGSHGRLCVCVCVCVCRLPHSHTTARTRM